MNLCNLTLTVLLWLTSTHSPSLSLLLQELFPVNKRSYDHFSKYFTDAGLKELSDFARNQQSLGARKELQKELQEQMSQGVSFKEVCEDPSTCQF